MNKEPRQICVTIQMDIETKRELKILAAKNYQSVSRFLLQQIDKLIQQNKTQTKEFAKENS